MIVFRDHKQENKRKEIFHHCYMLAIILNSSSIGWELRNSVLPMLFLSGNVKEVSTSTSTIQGCFFLPTGLEFNMSIAPVMYIRVLRNSVLHILFHSGNVKDVHLISTSTSTIKRCFFLLAGLQFKHVNLPQKLHGNENLPNERPYGT